MGTNLGTIAGQAVGEPLTQMSLKVIHMGAVAAGEGAKHVDSFTRLDQLLRLPKNLKDAATLSHKAGSVEKIDKDPLGGWGVHVGGARHYVPQNLGLADGIKEGAPIKKGQELSGGITNPRDVLDINGLPAVRQHLTSELSRVMGDKVSRKNLEVVVRSLTDLSEIDHAGDSEQWLTGDTAKSSAIMAENRRLAKEGKEQIHHRPMLAGISMIPLKSSEDWIARLNHTRLKDTILEASAKGWHSDIHGHNPIGPYAIGSEFGVSRPGHEGEY
jgi:DNA-directed RNA polymerase subunit beta'